MAFEEYDDFEQEQMVKEWIKNNWLTIAAGIVLGLGGVFGINYWKQQQQEKRFAAASKYEEFSRVLGLKELDEAQSVIAEMQGTYGDNFYTYEGHLLLAKEFVANNELEKAAAELQKVLDSQPQKVIADLVTLRLARIKNALGQHDQALSLAKSVTSESFASISKEVEGDAYLAKGEGDNAKTAFQQAVDSGEGYSGKRNIEMKLQNS